MLYVGILGPRIWVRFHLDLWESMAQRAEGRESSGQSWNSHS